MELSYKELDGKVVGKSGKVLNIIDNKVSINLRQHNIVKLIYN